MKASVVEDARPRLTENVIAQNEKRKVSISEISPPQAATVDPEERHGDHSTPDSVSEALQLGDVKIDIKEKKSISPPPDKPFKEAEDNGASEEKDPEDRTSRGYGPSRSGSRPMKEGRITSSRALNRSVEEGDDMASAQQDSNRSKTPASKDSTTTSSKKSSNLSGSDAPLTLDSQGPPKVITTKTSRSSTKPMRLRRGKWTVEEEAYVARVIQDFNSGYLNAPAGTTLRTYLSEKLQCDPMRITKKFTGDACIGKRVFHPAVRSPANTAVIDKAQAELEILEKRWRRRLEMQQRESAKKAAASAVAVRGAFSGAEGSDEPISGRNAVSRTASWLERAKSVLKDPSNDQSPHDESSELYMQMEEVKKLIHEGPIIHQASADLPEMIEKAAEQQDREGNSSPEPEPVDKRMRTAEDAEALVGFLRSVRASAASGQSF